MIKEIKEIIKSEEFKTWLKNPQLWETLDIDFDTPRVERVWMRVNDMRLSLHVIHPCKVDEAFLHPHTWESAMYILPIGGRYEHVIGCVRKVFSYTEGPKDVNEIVSTQEFRGDVYYEMLSPNGIHSVRPVGMPVFSVMLSGPVIWEENKIEVGKTLKPLSEERKIEILETFKNYFQ